IYPLMLVAGAAWAAIRRPGWLVWTVGVYVGFTVFTLSIFDNPQYNLRAQSLPTSYLVLLGAGAVPVWMAAWRRHRQRAAVLGIAAEHARAPMTAACRAVHERYAAAPLLLEDLHTEGYSMLRYAQDGRGVYRIGFYRLTPRI